MEGGGKGITGRGNNVHTTRRLSCCILDPNLLCKDVEMAGCVSEEGVADHCLEGLIKEFSLVRAVERH
jgi:hypothetical protein